MQAIAAIFRRKGVRITGVRELDGLNEKINKTNKLTIEKF
jgi:hypothetical protein